MKITLSTLVTWLLLAAIFSVVHGHLVDGGNDDPIIEAINAIGEETYTKQLIDISYKQGQLDTYTLYTLGMKAFNGFKNRRKSYMRDCTPEYGQLECAKAMYTAHENELIKLANRDIDKRQLTPVKL